MGGPKEEKIAANTADHGQTTPPPGHFLNSDLESDTARFLAELHASIARREERLARNALS
jgi:hypothetical protein